MADLPDTRAQDLASVSEVTSRMARARRFPAAEDIIAKLSVAARRLPATSLSTWPDADRTTITADAVRPISEFQTLQIGMACMAVLSRLAFCC